MSGEFEWPDTEEIEFGGTGARPRPVIIGLVVVFVSMVGLLFWKYHEATASSWVTPTYAASLASDVQVCCNGRVEVHNDKTFREAFEVHNYGSNPETITDVAVEMPASFHRFAVGLVTTSDANELGGSDVFLLSGYTMPPQSTAYVVIAGFVTCPAKVLDVKPTVSFKADGVTISSDIPRGWYGSWELDVATFGCGKKA